jgi:serralysin
MKPLFDFSDLIDGQLGVDDTIEGTNGNDTLLGTRGDDTLMGDKGDDLEKGLKGNDYVGGGQGDDTLIGGKGDDVLHGGIGADRLVGGNGADTFFFTGITDSNMETGVDTIADFHHGQGDMIDLSQIDADTTTDGDQAFTVVSQFSGHAGQLVLAHAETGYIVEGDVNGDGQADFEIAVHTNGSFTANDFVL